MDIFEFRDYCLSLPLVEESTPFDETTLVYKIGGRMFAAAFMMHFDHIALKCDPDRAEELRERYDEVTPAWHFNKRHWNDVRTDADLPDVFIRGEIRHAYLQTLHKNVTPKARREEILRYVEAHGLPE